MRLWNRWWDRFTVTTMIWGVAASLLLFVYHLPEVREVTRNGVIGSYILTFFLALVTAAMWHAIEEE